MLRRILILANVRAAARWVDPLRPGLDWDFEPVLVSTCAAVVEQASSVDQPPAAILLDAEHGGARVLEWLEALLAAARHVPIFVLAGLDQEPLAELAIELGAQDYVLDAALHLSTLRKTVRHGIARAAHLEELLLERERAQVTLDSIGEAVVASDFSGRITYVNRIAAGMMGLGDPQQSLGRRFTDLIQIRSGDGADPQNPPARAIAANAVVKLPPESYVIRRDGSRLDIEDSASPIRDRHGRTTGAVMVVRDVSSKREMSRQLNHFAYHDMLTGLPNRLLFDDRLSQSLAIAQRSGGRLAILFIDVDRLKLVNDTYGHAAGDTILRSVATRLQQSVRAMDTVCRRGGDEFLALLPAISKVEDAVTAASKFLAAVARPHVTKQQVLHVTASIGIAVYPDDGTEPATLIRHADVAMLSAKRSGRNSSQVFLPSMRQNDLERQTLETLLHTAMDRQEFFLVYQAKFDLTRQAVVGSEALIRWEHPERGLIQPEIFIPVAEQCGFIVPIGRWVLREACGRIRRDLEAGREPVPIAVNVSAVELRSQNFVGNVRAVLEEMHVEGRYLEFEITETALMHDPGANVAMLRAVKELGIRLALDDFGTGYSSLSYLKKFPIDVLKIDRSFVSGLCSSEADAHIVRAVIDMAKSFGLRVVAEGIETLEQLKELRALGCGEGQGYFLRRPEAPVRDAA